MYTRKRCFDKTLCLLLCLVLFMGLVPSAQASMLRSAPLSTGNTQNGMVRVRLSSLGNPSTLNLTVHGSYTVNGKSSRTISSGSSVTVKFNSSTGALSLTYGGSTSDMGTAFKLRRHETSGQNGIKIAQGRVPSNLYPGDFYFVSKSASNGYQLYVIAYIYMEDYLYGVLPYEMGNSSGLEALKAQAVTARTYTMRAMSSSSSRLYDVVDTTSDQVYSGTPSGNANCKAAVDATKGIVAKNGSSFTATYYTASNGGQTESVKNAWGSNSYSYLTVKDDPYDLANSASRKISFTVNKSGPQSNAALSTLLNTKAASVFGAGAAVNGVSKVTPHTPKYSSPSRLYTKLDFTVSYTKNGATSSGTLTFDIFKELEAPLKMSINSGSNELWSVSETSSAFIVSSRRYGHGIGMSQRGAMYMAQMGYTYDQILAFYFEGCTRVQYTLTRSILSAVVSGQESQEQVIPEAPAELETAQAGTAIVKLPSANDTVTLRYEPTQYTSTIVQIPNGATVKVYAASGDDCLVGYGELCGYVPRAWLSITGEIPASTTMKPTKLAAHGTVINSNALNLRSSPSMNSTVYTTIPGDTMLPLLEIGDEWSRTQYGLRVGYVSNDFLEIHGSGPSIDDPQWTPTLAPQPENPSAVLQARVTTEKGSLNLRAQESGSARVLTTIPQYTVINILQKGNTWCQTSYNGHTGYVMTKFLTFISQATAAPALTPAPTLLPTFAPTQAPAAVGVYATVTTAQGSLNLRATANDQSMVLRTIPQYATIQILEKGPTWCKTTYNGYTGFVMTKFLNFISQPTQQPPSSPTLAPTAQSTPASTLRYAQVTTVQGSLNLRSAAKNNATVLTTIPQYEMIPIYQYGATWCQTSYAGFTGFVMTSFLTLDAQPSWQPTQGPATATPAPAQTSAPSSSTMAQVTTEKGSLNMREYPGSNKVLRTIPQFAYVTVLQKGCDWCQVSYYGQTGFVMTKFLTFQSSATRAPATAAPTQAPVTAPTLQPTQAPQTPPAFENGAQARVNTPFGSLNLRAGANDEATVLRTIPQYEIVIILEYGQEWSKVVYSGSTGYVMTQYLSSVSQPPVTQAPTQKPTVAPSVPQSPSSSIVCYARVTTQKGSLNLRIGAWDGAAVLTTIPQYATVPVYSKGSTWCQVSYNGTTGYVMTKFLSFQDSPASTFAPQAPAVPSPTAAPVVDYNTQRDHSMKKLNTMVLSQVKPQNGSRLSLYQGCSELATQIAEMPKDDYVIITHVGDTWCTVQYEGKTGYCLRKHLEFELYE